MEFSNNKIVKPQFCCTLSILQVHFKHLCFITFWALEHLLIETMFLKITSFFFINSLTTCHTFQSSFQHELYKMKKLYFILYYCDVLRTVCEHLHELYTLNFFLVLKGLNKFIPREVLFSFYYNLCSVYMIRYIYDMIYMI